MRQKVPHSPLSTRLSGGAREMELRLLGMFQWKHKRPPLLMTALLAAVALGCGGLVGLRSAPPEPTPVPVQVSIAAESLVSEDILNMLTEEQRQLLADPPIDQLPTEVAEIQGRLPWERIWRGTLLPVARDGDVTLYLVLARDPVKNLWQEAGVFLRHGERTQYFPLYMDDWGGNPGLWVRDFDGDGVEEAAAALHIGHGTGANAQALYLFELDSMTYRLPDYGTIRMDAAYDPETGTALFTSGADSVAVEVPEHCGPLFKPCAGMIVSFRCQEDQLFCDLGLSLTAPVTNYATAAVLPLSFSNGALGEAVFEPMNDVFS